MKRNFMLGVTVIVFSFMATGQHARHAVTDNLAGTTWVIYYNECTESNWTEHNRVTFLLGGKLQGSNGSWRRTGNKLRLDARDLYITNMDVVQRGNQMTGTAELGMSNLRDYCVRLVRELGTSTTARDGDWDSFWKSFRTAVNGRNRAALRKLMAPHFAYPGEGAVSPDTWLRSIDSQKVWRQVWRELEQSIAKSTKSLVDNSGLDTRVTNDNSLLFRRGDDGKWRWIGFMGD